MNPMKKTLMTLAMLALAQQSHALELPATVVSGRQMIRLDFKLTSAGETMATMSASVPDGGALSTGLLDSSTPYLASAEYGQGKPKEVYKHLDFGDNLILSPAFDEQGKIKVMVSFNRSAPFGDDVVASGGMSFPLVGSQNKYFMQKLVLDSGKSTSVALTKGSEGDDAVILELTATASERG
jgi:hypothetical protein